MDLNLDVYGVRIAMSGDPDATALLAIHFHAFVTTARAEPDVRIELVRGTPGLPSHVRLEADQILERGVVYNRGPLTWVDHHGLALSEYDFSRERGRVTAPVPEDLVELGYLMAHSRLGILLERRGLFRVHALGVSKNGRAAIVLTPSGGGKSRLALGVLRRTDAYLLGDDVVLLDRDGTAYPFPHPIGISQPDAALGLGRAAPFVRRQHPPKWLLELPDLRNRLAIDPVPVRLLAVHRRVSVPPDRVVPATRRNAAEVLFRDLVVGLGLPQVLELVARRGAVDLPRMLPAALGRLRAATAVLAHARSVVLEVSDPEASAEILVTELERC